MGNIKPQSAPLNPAFEKYTKANSGNIKTSAIKKHGTGYIPPPVDLSHVKESQNVAVEAQAFPAHYDLREHDKVTSVKDQDQTGTCWIFATYGSLESYLMPGQPHNFSEQSMKDLLSSSCPQGFDRGYNAGGNEFMSTAYLARWSGPVLERDDPFNPDTGGYCTQFPVNKHVQRVVFIPPRSSFTSNSIIKNTIIKYGAMLSSMYMNETAYYRASTAAYYYYGTRDTNHCIDIIGWDDNYSRNNFRRRPPGNGAFIAKNSWGTDFGKKGYFYISYFDTRIGLENAMYNSAQSPGNFKRIYQYDPLGWTATIGYSSPTAWFANLFRVAATEKLRAVSFYTTGLQTSYTIYIYTGVQASKPRSGTLKLKQSGSINYPGFYTVNLSSPVQLTSGSRYSIVVKVNTPGSIYPIATEMPIFDYSSKARAQAGQSFISSNGTNWDDTTTFFPNTNVCLKGYSR
ncbi:MAG: lectin like domain-containing protein [Methylocystaceae bacterium]